MTDAVSYSVKDAAAAVGLTDDVIRAAYKCGDLPVHYYRSKPLIMRADLEAWIRSMPSERAAS